MMKCIVRVESPLMFNINKNRAHDVRKRITQLVDEDGGRGANLKGKTIIRRKFATTKSSREGKLLQQKTVEKTAILKNS